MVIYFSPVHVKEYNALGATKYYAMFCLMRGKYTSGHYHSKQEIPEWYTRGISQWYRDLKKMHDLGLIDLGRNGRGFRLRSIKHGLEQNKDGKVRLCKEQTNSLQDLINSFEEKSLLANLSSQQKKRVYKKFSVTKKSNISKGRKKAIRFELRKVRNISVDEILDPNNKYATFLSCAKSGQLLGKSAFTGRKVLNRLINRDAVRRKITYRDRGMWKPEEVRGAIRRLQGVRFPLIQGTKTNKEGKVHLLEKVVTVAYNNTNDILLKAISNLLVRNKTAKM